MMTEEEGVRAIQYLLNMMGQSEPEELSRYNWNHMSEHEKEVTMNTYHILHKEENNGKGAVSETMGSTLGQ